VPIKGQIDLQQVVQIAVGLADEHGFEAVTLASVARELGIRLPSLYNYVDGLPGLRQQMMLRGLRQLNDQLRRAAIGKAGDDAILSVANAYRAFAHAHPGLYTVTLRTVGPDQPELANAAQEVVELILLILQPYGLNGDDAIHAVRALRSVLHGFVDLENSGGFGLPLDRDETFRRLVEMFIKALHGLREAL
jgi:AcrR family transcriptional regulator